MCLSILRGRGYWPFLGRIGPQKRPTQQHMQAVKI
jgi:hypothetical protein